MTTKHEVYYVPEQSRLPILASIGLFCTVFGLGSWFNEMKSDSSGPGTMLFSIGLVFFCIVLYRWFATVVTENLKGLNSVQLKRSYVWGMGWFIFSEVMFFSAFFGALWYIRNVALPGLSEPHTSELLWNNFSAEWPLMSTPEQALKGEGAEMVGPATTFANPGLGKWGSWLPFWNTLVLLSSSVTVHFAHSALKNDNKKSFNIWLGVTVALGFTFLVLQYMEYSHAYHSGLTLQSGIYGATFFMLTGFHGLHVTMGTVMLLVQLLRSVFKNHFKHDDCFGFEASTWYWHFVDVVWLGLFIFVYIM